MTPPPVRTAEELAHVLAAYGLAGASLRDIRTGRVNRHWRVEAGDGLFALRRYQDRRSAAAVRYEHDALEHLAGKGWPVAVPVPAPGGKTSVEVAGRRYALFPFLPGRPASAPGRRYRRLQGRLLARLHGDLASWRPPGQREGFGRVWELDVFVRAWSSPAFETLNGVLMAFGRDHADLARLIRSHQYAMLRELSSLGYGELPALPGHFDFHHDNLLFQQGELTGVLDFDFVRLDARVADVATSIASDCRAPPAYNDIDPEAAGAFVAGYSEHAPLSDQELQLVTPLARAYLLWLVAYRLTEWAQTGSTAALRGIQRTAGVRLRSFAERRDGLEAAVLQAGTEGEERRRPGR
jgi:homoserine kinase type II